jgi:D-amino peptidase
MSCSSAPLTYTSGGRVVEDAADDRDGVTKILLYYDMEGISGQNDLRTLSYGNPEYEPAREWLTNDVNAVVDGLFAGGADEVDVVDAHGSGNPEPDILVDRMDPRARLLDRAEPFRPYVDLTESGTYDAVAVVCMHSKTGGGGFAAHTYTLGMDWLMNDMSINETEIVAYAWGQVGVPVIFASGDNTLAEQLSWMDWLEYVTVKTAISADDAELRPFDEVHSEMRAAASRAVENLPASKAVMLTTPIKAQLRAVPPADLSQLEGVPGIDYRDQTVTFVVDDYQSAYDGIEALIGVATANYMQLLNATLGEQPNGSDIRDQFVDALVGRWADVESGRWEPPEPPVVTHGDRRYFGVN